MLPTLWKKMNIKLFRNDILKKPICVHSMLTLEIPTDELINMTGFSVQQLKMHNILPQRFGKHYKLLVSDLSSISVSEFEGIGVPIYQTKQKTIIKIWKFYDKQIVNLDSLEEYYRKLSI